MDKNGYTFSHQSYPPENAEINIDNITVILAKLNNKIAGLRQEITAFKDTNTRKIHLIETRNLSR